MLKSRHSESIPFHFKREKITRLNLQKGNESYFVSSGNHTQSKFKPVTVEKNSFPIEIHKLPAQCSEYCATKSDNGMIST